MATISETPRVAILADASVTGPSARFTVTVKNNTLLVAGPTELDGVANTGPQSGDVVGGVVWLDRHGHDFELQLAFPGTGTSTVTCVDRNNAAITATWSGQVATLKFEATHVEKNYAVTCTHASADAGPDGVTFTVRPRSGTSPNE